MRTWLGLAIVVLGMRFAHADGLPEATTLKAEPKAKPWLARARSTFWTGELFVEGSPAGWAVHREGNQYTALARVAPGFIRWGPRAMVFGGVFYEVSRLSQSTFGAQLSVIRFENDRAPVGIGVGALSDLDRRIGGSVRIQIAAFGIEAQIRDTDRGPTGALYLMFTFPLRVIHHEIASS